MNISQIFAEYERRAIENRDLGDKIIARIGHQPRRKSIWDASLVKLAMDEEDGDLSAGKAIDELLLYLGGDR